MDNLIIKYGGYLLYSGEKLEIIAAITKSGNSPFMDYFRKLTSAYNEKAKKEIKKRDIVNIDFACLKHYFERLGNHGLWNNKKQIRSLGGGFWELKNENTGMRIPFYFDEMNNNVIILTHYFHKNEQKTKKEALKKMRDIKKEFIEVRQKRGGAK